MTELDELSKLLKITLEENTVVVFKAPKADCSRLAKNLGHIDVFKRYKITPLVCPDSYEIVVIHPRNI